MSVCRFKRLPHRRVRRDSALIKLYVSENFVFSDLYRRVSVNWSAATLKPPAWYCIGHIQPKQLWSVRTWTGSMFSFLSLNTLKNELSGCAQFTGIMRKFDLLGWLGWTESVKFHCWLSGWLGLISRFFFFVLLVMIFFPL